MADLSKTAKASMKAGQAPKEKVAITPERAIKTIREYRESGLMVLNVEYYDLLLAEYDKVLAENVELKASNVIHDAANKVNAATIERLMTELEAAHLAVDGYQKIARQELELSTAKTEVIAELAGEPGLGAAQGTDSIGG
jgi:hypothetical protein